MTKYLKIVGFITAALVFLVLVILSPLFFQLTAQLLPLDVEYLSKIGGSYGAISAILSSMAIIIVAATAILQVRQTRIAQLHAVRTMQLELLRMSLDDPFYRGALGDAFQQKPEKHWKMHAYCNLWVMHFQMAFLTNAIDENGLRAWASNELFASETGLKFWEEARLAFRAEIASSKHRTFFSALDQSYEEKRELGREAAQENPPEESVQTTRVDPPC